MDIPPKKVKIVITKTLSHLFSFSKLFIHAPVNYKVTAEKWTVCEKEKNLKTSTYCIYANKKTNNKITDAAINHP